MSAEGPPPPNEGPEGRPPTGPPPPAAYPQQPPGYGQPPPGYPQQPPPGYGYPAGAHPPAPGNYPGHPGYPPPRGEPGKTSWQLIVGGVITIVYASFILLMGLAILAIGGLVNDLERAFGDVIGEFSSFIFILALIVLGFAAFGLIAGIQTIRRSRVGWILTYVFMGFITFLLIVGLFDGETESDDIGGILFVLAGAVTVLVVISLSGARRALKA